MFYGAHVSRSCWSRTTTLIKGEVTLGTEQDILAIS